MAAALWLNIQYMISLQALSLGAQASLCYLLHAMVQRFLLLAEPLGRTEQLAQQLRADNIYMQGWLRGQRGAHVLSSDVIAVRKGCKEVFTLQEVGPAQSRGLRNQQSTWRSSNVLVHMYRAGRGHRRSPCSTTCRKLSERLSTHQHLAAESGQLLG